MNSRTYLTIGILVIVLALLIGLLVSRMPASTPPAGTPDITVSTTTVESATSSPTAAAGQGMVAPHTTTVNPVPVSPTDHTASWSFTGSYTGANAVKKQAEIATLTSELGTGKYADSDIYTGIGQDYELLGDGQNAYLNYVKAAEADTSLGLALNDIGELMERLGAVNTARAAYQAAVAKEPTVEVYQLAYLSFLRAHDPSSAATAAAFASAKVALNASPNFLVMEANWYASIGNKTAAIADWELVRPKVGASQQASIDATIAALKGGQ